VNLVKIKDVSEAITGFPFKSDLYEESGIRTVRGENISEGILRWDSTKCWNEPFEKTEYYSLRPDDIVIGMDGSKVGKNKARIFQSDLPLLLAQRVACIRSNPNLVDQIFLYYCINNPRFEKYVSQIQTGSSVPHISRSQIEDFKIPFPSLNEQKKIGRILSDLDKKIRFNNSMNTKLESIAKLIYDYWFVQFDFPDENDTPYKSSGGKMVYNEKLKKNIPEAWEVGELKFWIDCNKSGDWGKEKSEGSYTEKVSCVRGADIDGLNGQGKVKAPERYILNKNTHKILDAGDLVIEISGGSPTQSTGRLGYIIDSTLERFKNPLICSNFCRAITLTDRKYIYNFIQLWNRLYNAGVLFGWEGKTSGIKNLLLDPFLSNYSHPIPDYKLVEKYYEKVDPIYTKIQQNLKENKKLVEIRNWLLPMLMNGQVKVKP